MITLADLAERAKRIDARSTWPVAVGALLVPVGIAVILLAWYGSAHTPYIQQQIPYLVSGSFIGLGLMILGGLLYWSHWLYRIYDQANLNHALDVVRTEELFGRLIEAVGASQGDRNEPARADRAPRDRGAQSALVATATGTNAHRPDCPVIRRHPVGVRTLTAEQVRAARPCRICNAVIDDGGQRPR